MDNFWYLDLILGFYSIFWKILKGAPILSLLRFFFFLLRLPAVY